MPLRQALDIAYENAKNNSDIKQYTGNGSDTNEYNVYYYNHGLNNSSKNNVLFAGFCWKIVRTTATGGVKLLYNGIPDNNSCSSNRVGVLEDDTIQTLNLTNNSLYSNSFTYDEKILLGQLWNFYNTWDGTIPDYIPNDDGYSISN